MLDNTLTQPSKFKAKNWVKINDAHGANSTNSQIKFQTSIMMSSLCGYIDVYILLSGTIRIPNTGTTAVPNNRKNVIKVFAPFADCTSEITNTQ